MAKNTKNKLENKTAHKTGAASYSEVGGAKVNSEETFTGQLLIATHNMRDTPFDQGVVLLFDHDDGEGSLGVMINKPLEVKLSSILEHINIPAENTTCNESPVFLGGPIHQESGFLIYLDESNPKEKNTIRISSSRDLLQDVACNKPNAPKTYMVILGCCAWKNHELQEEILKDDWILSEPNIDLIFHTPISQRWNEAFRLLGINVANLVDESGNA